jgi:aminopeptidase N
MLRARLGDDTFFKGVANYIDTHKYGQAETADLRIALEHAAGESLQRFFDQWCYRPGVPAVAVTPSYNAATRELTITMEQTQPIDGANPAFDIAVPMHVVFADGGIARPTIRFDTHNASITLGSDAEPAFVAVDPSLTVLADFRVDQSSNAWISQLQSGPTIGTRLRAAASLGNQPRESVDDTVVQALTEAASRKSNSRSLRVAAIQSLAKLNAQPGLRALADDMPGDPRVRTPLLRALATTSDSDQDVVQKLELAMKRDRSYSARAAVLQGLAESKSDLAFPLALDALNVDSQHDQIRQAALIALAVQPRTEAIDAVLPFIESGVFTRTRQSAAESLGKLAPADPERVVQALAALLNDSEPRTVRAAGEALSRINSSEARQALENYAARARSAVERFQAATWLKTSAETMSR